MTGQLSFPAEWKAVAGSGAGELDGYGVFFNNIDLGDDVALPGSCRKTLTEREASGRPWPLIADHELATSGVIGSAHNAREDGQGVRLRARFASTQKAQDVRTLVLEGPSSAASTRPAARCRPRLSSCSGTRWRG